MKVKIFFLFALLMAAMLLIIAARLRAVPVAPGTPSVAALPMSDFTFRDYGGTLVQLSSFRGVPVMINTWASWCVECIRELSDLAAIQKEFGEKIKIIAVNRGETYDVAFSHLWRAGLGIGALTFLSDPSDSFYTAIGGFSMPETVFINADGIMVDHKRGPMNAEEIRRRIQRAFGI